MRTTPLRIAGSLGVAAALSLGVVACGSSGSSSSGASGTTDQTMAQSSTTMAGSTADLSKANFGPGCAAVPTSGSGSFAGMAADPAATAASNNPALSTLVTAVTAAGLVDTLNGPGPFTIFAPTNDAFAKIPAATLNSVLADPTGALTKILTYHVIAGALAPDQLAGTHKTLEGGDLTISGNDPDFVVGTQKASIVCGNVKTANATVYIIDTVLMPPKM
jgi:uncharacterized surface protein with fasciclin (FAS1) repeats